MVDVQPGFYEGVDGYEQAWKVDIISSTKNLIKKRYQISLSYRSMNPITYYHLLQSANLISS